METLVEALQSIFRYKHRALATGFGVFWGVFIVTVLQAGGEGLRLGLANLYKDSARSMIWVWSDRASVAHKGLAAGRATPLRAGELRALESGEIAELENLSPRFGLPATTQVSHGTHASNPQTFGVYPAYAMMEQLVVIRGRWLNQLDLRDKRRVAVIGTAMLPALYDGEDPLGTDIRIQGVPFSVVGVFEDPGGEVETQRVYVPYPAVSTMFGGEQRVHAIVGTLREDAPIPETRHKIVSMLARRLGASQEDPRAVGVWFAAEQYRRLVVLMRGITLAIVIVGLGTLLSGMVGVSNILFITVRERAQEFGIRRALGATAGSIVRLVLTEACMLSLLAGGAGLSAAVLAVHLARGAGIETDYFRDPSVDFAQTWITVLALSVSALLAGTFPAREAARVQPVEALNRS